MVQVTFSGGDIAALIERRYGTPGRRRERGRHPHAGADLPAAPDVPVRGQVAKIGAAPPGSAPTTRTRPIRPGPGSTLSAPSSVSNRNTGCPPRRRRAIPDRPHKVMGHGRRSSIAQAPARPVRRASSRAGPRTSRRPDVCAAGRLGRDLCIDVAGPDRASPTMARTTTSCSLAPGAGNLSGRMTKATLTSALNVDDFSAVGCELTVDGSVIDQWAGRHGHEHGHGDTVRPVLPPRRRPHGFKLRCYADSGADGIGLEDVGSSA